MEYNIEALLQQIGEEAEANMSRPGVEAMAFTTVTGADAQEFFCEYWDDIKKAIEFLGGLGGAWGRVVAKGLVIIGDRYYARNCG